MDTQSSLLLALAAIMIGIRLPSFMTRLGMSRKDKIITVVALFAMLLLAYFLL